MRRARPVFQARERGAALLAALCFATVLTIALGSYITVCYRTLSLSSRSAQSTHSIEVAETGMEEVLWALNNSDWSGWAISGSTAMKTLTGFTFENGATGTAALTVTNYNGGGVRTVTAAGTTSLTNGTALTRTLGSTSAQAALFVNAVAATTGRVKFKSGGSADSYDSSLGDYAVQTPTYSAVISSGSTATSPETVQLTNAQIKGYVSTLSTGPSYSGSAKLVGPSSGVGVKIDAARISTSPYQPTFAESAATGASTLLPGGTTTIGTPGATSPALYHATDVLLGGANVLTINGPVVLTISGNLSISGTAKIRITTTGSLQIHLSGDLGIDGNGIQNDTKLPRNCAILNTTSDFDTLEMGTGTVFYGVIYTPMATLTISNSQTIYGALVGRAVVFSASPVLHYDLNLRNVVFSGIETPYAVVNWHETTNGG